MYFWTNAAVPTLYTLSVQPSMGICVCVNGRCTHVRTTPLVQAAGMWALHLCKWSFGCKERPLVLVCEDPVTWVGNIWAEGACAHTWSSVVWVELHTRVLAHRSCLVSNKPQPWSWGWLVLVLFFMNKIPSGLMQTLSVNWICPV